MGSRRVLFFFAIPLLLVALIGPAQAHHRPDREGGAPSPHPTPKGPPSPHPTPKGPPSPHPTPKHTPAYPPATPRGEHKAAGPELLGQLIDGALHVSITGAAGGTTGNLYLGDARLLLGAFEIGEDGTFQKRFALPAGATSSSLKVVAIAELASGNASLETIAVGQQLPVRSDPTRAAAAIAAVLTLALIAIIRRLMGRRPRRRRRRPTDLPHLDTGSFSPRAAVYVQPLSFSELDAYAGDLEELARRGAIPRNDLVGGERSSGVLTMDGPPA